MIPPPQVLCARYVPYPSGVGPARRASPGYRQRYLGPVQKAEGFNVLHPMGYDAFGLPAEQYAIEHGIHPQYPPQTISPTYRKQLDNIGLFPTTGTAGASPVAFLYK